MGFFVILARLFIISFSFFTSCFAYIFSSSLSYRLYYSLTIDIVAELLVSLWLSECFLFFLPICLAFSSFFSFLSLWVVLLGGGGELSGVLLS